MPLCGLKQSKKQKRDPSPPYRQDNESLVKVKSLEESLAKQKQSYERLQQKYDELKAKQQETTAHVEKAESLFADVSGVDLEKSIKETEKKLEEEYKKKNADLQSGLQKQLDAQRAELEEGERKLRNELNQTRERLDREAADRAKFEAERDKLKREKDTIEQTLNLTKKELDLANKESHIPRSPTRPPEEWKAKITAAEAELQKEREQRMNKERELSRLLSEAEQLQKEKASAQDELSRAMHAGNDDLLNSLKQSLETAEKNYKNELSRKDLELAELTKKFEEEVAAKDSLMTRLSATTAAKVLDNNPNISDLSDPNRPQKLGERFMSLYENQWSEASDALEKLGKSEQEIVDTLLDLVVNVYKHCKESAETQLSRIEEDIFLPPMESPVSPMSPEHKDSPAKTPSKQSMSRIPRFSSHKGRPALPNMNTEKKTVIKGETFPEIPVEVRKGIKEYRKAVCKKVTPVIEREVLNSLRAKFEEKVIDGCKTFIGACVEICWLMNIQDPPIVMKWKAPDDKLFNADIYKAYLQNGSQVDYVVWPALFLYEGGTLLSKGVAQGMDA